MSTVRRGEENLYPGQDTTGLLPIDTFAKEPLYLPGREPSEAEALSRIDTYWKPYHAALERELERIRRAHGYALLWDAHSILSHVPRFFSGRLPDFNLGTADGRSCGSGLGKRLHAIAGRASGYSAVIDARFKGGYIIRHYGNPRRRIHVVQLAAVSGFRSDEPRGRGRRRRRGGRVAALRDELCDRRDRIRGWRDQTLTRRATEGRVRRPALHTACQRLRIAMASVRVHEWQREVQAVSGRRRTGAAAALQRSKSSPRSGTLRALIISASSNSEASLANPPASAVLRRKLDLA